MATNFSTLYNDVMPEVPGAGTAMVLNALRRVARDFCTYSKVDRRGLAPITTIVGTAVYALTAPAGTDIIEVLRVEFDDGTGKPSKLTPILIDEVWDDNSQTGQPKQYAVDQNEILTLFPTPNASNSIVVTVALAPLMTSLTLTDQLALDWGHAIAIGAKSRLMAMPKKLWSEPVTAARYRNDFEMEMAAARLSSVRGKTRAPVRTVPATIMGR